jgi:cytosine/adenosine deaminase-related metal-dependent hydrolase
MGVVMAANHWWCENAWLPSGVAADVLITVDEGRIITVEAGVPPSSGANRLRGLVIPGMANGHSHAFHRALRSRTQRDRGSFWTWRDLMYRAAERLNPDRYRRLARAVYAEMALAGITAVGEFHYLHHDLGGVHYNDPNEMGHCGSRRGGCSAHAPGYLLPQRGSGRIRIGRCPAALQRRFR